VKVTVAIFQTYYNNQLHFLWLLLVLNTILSLSHSNFSH
jgi:hypothetical protein